MSLRRSTSRSPRAGPEDLMGGFATLFNRRSAVMLGVCTLLLGCGSPTNTPDGAGGSSMSSGNGGSAVPAGRSAGCGKPSTVTFGTVPGESGQNVGTGMGGYVTIQSSGQTRGFAMRLPDNYDNAKPYWLIFGFHWNGGTSKDV